MYQKKTQIVGLIIAILICLGAGGFGAMATTPEIDGWYKTITKPSWNPPAFIFGPVWTTLYILMGISVWLVWRRNDFKVTKIPLALFAIQLILNIAWSWIFFSWHQLGWAFVDIIALWIAILATILSFLKVSKQAGYLLLPYFAWVSFASVLNFTIWQLN